MTQTNLHSWWLHHKYSKEATHVSRMSSETYPRKFTLGEVVLIHGMVGEDAKHNGKEGIIERLAYIHPDSNRIVFNVRIMGDELWALEPWNIKKTGLDPYDGNKVMTWSDPRCVWRPDPNFKRPIPDSSI